MKISDLKQVSFLIYMLSSQVVVLITIILDISVVRQVLGFIYLTFVPGFLLLRIFKLERLSVQETVLFSVGLSISFLMIIGLLINELGSSLVSKPLSSGPLFIIISICILLVSFISYFKGEKIFHVMNLRNLGISRLIPYFVLPLLGIVGVMVTTGFGNNLLSVLTIVTIAILFLAVSFSRFSLCYPLILASIASTLLLATFLTSNYIHGYDIHLDYYISNLTKNVGYWNLSLGLNTYYSTGWPLYIYNSMLSVTVLSAVFSNILNIEEIWIYKILYPLIFSLVPLGLYELYRRLWGERIAFFSVLFFMSNTVFFDFRNTAKQMIAEPFYILLFLLLLNNYINKRSKWVIFGCFSFALVVSYYTMSYIFLFLILSTWLCTKILGKKGNIKIDLSAGLFFSLLTFLWYVYYVKGPFVFFARFLEGSFKNFFEEFFNPRSRAGSIVAATGILSPPSFFHYIGRMIFNVTTLFILIGFIVLIVKRNKEKLDPEYFILVSLNMILLLTVIILPNLSKSLQMDRMYHVSLLFVSPLFVLGGRTFFGNLLKILRLKSNKTTNYSWILVLALLVAFFLFQTGFVYEITGDPVPSSISLSKYRMDDYTRLDLGLVNENDFFGAAWLSKYVNVENAQIYSDTQSRFQVLTSSMVNRNDSIVSISNITIFTRQSYIYLNRYNTRNGILIYDPRHSFDIRYKISEIYIFNSTVIFNNKLYSNGACEIYYYCP